MRYRNIVGLDQDGNDLFAAELLLLREGPSLQMTGHLRAPAELPITQELLARYLRDLLGQGPFAARAAAMAIPRAGAAQRQLDLPPLGPAETAQAVAAAMEEQIAFNQAEIVLGWERLGNRSIRAIAARRHLVAAANEAVNAAGLVPARLELHPFAAAAAFMFYYGDEVGGETAVLIELRSEESALVLLRGGAVVSTRALPGLGEDGLVNLKEFAAELRTTYDLLSAAPDWAEPDCLWVTGPHAARQDVREELASRLDLDDGFLRLAKPRGLLRPANIPEPGPEMLVPVGLCLGALGLFSLGPDLLPGLDLGAAPRRRTIVAAVLPLVLILGLSLAGTRLLLAGAGRQAEASGSWLAEHQAQVAKLSSMQTENIALAERLKSLQSFGGQAVYLDLLAALDRAVPPGTRVSRLSLNGDTLETLELVTPSVTLLLQDLHRDPLLAGLDLRGAAVSRVVGGMTMEACTLTGPLAGGEASP